MRVAVNALFWTQPRTGSGQYTRELVRALAAVAPDVDVQLVFPAPGGYRVAPAGEAHEGPATPSNAAKLRFEQIEFPRAVRALAADVAHVPYWAPPASCPAPLAVTVHDIIPRVLRDYRGGLLVRAYTALVSSTARGATAILTDSEASKRDIVAHLGISGARVHAVPLAAGPAFQPRPLPGEQAARDRYNLPAQYVLYLGSFEARKNIEALFAAYTFVMGAVQDQLPLVLGGRQHAPDGKLYPDVQARARAYELLRPESRTEEDVVRFIGAVDEADKPAVYRGATAFMFASLYEGFGLPPLEAMACGVPVIVSNSSSLPEVVDGAGFVLDPDDTRGMAGAVLALFNQQELAEQLRAQGVQRAATFSWERTARETLAVYRSIAR